jgi:hypothetical protein
MTRHVSRHVYLFESSPTFPDMTVVWVEVKVDKMHEKLLSPQVT